MEASPFQIPEQVIYTSDASEVDDVVLTHFTPDDSVYGDDSAKFSVLGFDIEWKPNTSRGRDNPTAVLQVRMSL